MLESEDEIRAIADGANLGTMGLLMARLKKYKAAAEASLEKGFLQVDQRKVDAQLAAIAAINEILELPHRCQERINEQKEKA